MLRATINIRQINELPDSTKAHRPAIWYRFLFPVYLWLRLCGREHWRQHGHRTASRATDQSHQHQPPVCRGDMAQNNTSIVSPQVFVACLLAAIFVMFSGTAAALTDNPTSAIAIWLVYAVVVGIIINPGESALFPRAVSLSILPTGFVFGLQIYSDFVREGKSAHFGDILTLAENAIPGTLIVMVFLVTALCARPALINTLRGIRNLDVSWMQALADKLKKLNELIKNLWGVVQTLVTISSVVMAWYIANGQ
jgi:hypothetical protein